MSIPTSIVNASKKAEPILFGRTVCLHGPDRAIKWFIIHLEKPIRFRFRFRVRISVRVGVGVRVRVRVRVTWSNPSS